MTSKHAIILIPGFGFKDGDFTLYFLGKLKEICIKRKILWEGYETIKQEDHVYKKLQYNNNSIDIYEAYWHNLIRVSARKMRR